MSYELIISQIKDGGLPSFVGMEAQVNEIKSLLELRKQDYCEKIDKYFDACVAIRLVKNYSMSAKHDVL